MPGPRSFLSSRKWFLLLLCVAILFGLAMLHPYPRQSLFGPKLRGEPWCVWEDRVRHYVHGKRAKSPMTKALAWVGIKPKEVRLTELLDDAEMLPLVIHLLDDPDPKVRNNCLKAFVFFKVLRDEQALPSLYRVYRDRDTDERLYAADAIWRIKKDKTVAHFVVGCLDDRDDEIRRSAAMTLSGSNMCEHTPELFPFVAKHSRDGDTEVRQNVMAMMRQFGKKGVPILMEGLVDRDYEVRSWAAGMLDQLGVHTKEAVPVLIESLDIARSVGAIDDRIFGAQMLGRCGSDATAAIPELEKLLNDPSPEMCRAARDALLAIDPERFAHLKKAEK